jgi:hypothetical protein
MLRKGDLVEWTGTERSIGILLEDQKSDSPRILVFWLDFNEPSKEPIEWMTLIRGQDNEV